MQQNYGRIQGKRTILKSTVKKKKNICWVKFYNQYFRVQLVCEYLRVPLYSL